MDGDDSARENLLRRGARQCHRRVTESERSSGSLLLCEKVRPSIVRNRGQQQRIEQGVQSGQLTNREVGNLEKGQANVNRKEARAGANGHISANEQHNIQAAENHQSRKIHREKHNDRER
jgi:hypothetical protein